MLQCSEEITPQLWENCCRHVKQLENDYWMKDDLLDDLDPVIVSVGSDRDSSSDDDDDGGNDVVE